MTEKQKPNGLILQMVGIFLCIIGVIVFVKIPKDYFGQIKSGNEHFMAIAMPAILFGYVFCIVGVSRYARKKGKSGWWAAPTAAVPIIGHILTMIFLFIARDLSEDKDRITFREWCVDREQRAGQSQLAWGESSAVRPILWMAIQAIIFLGGTLLAFFLYSIIFGIPFLDNGDKHTTFLIPYIFICFFLFKTGCFIQPEKWFGDKWIIFRLGCGVAIWLPLFLLGLAV